MSNLDKNGNYKPMTFRHAVRCPLAEKGLCRHGEYYYRVLKCYYTHMCGVDVDELSRCPKTEGVK